MLPSCISAVARQMSILRIRSAPHFRHFVTKGFLGFKSPGDLVSSARKAIATSEELQTLLLDCGDASRSLRYADDISNALCRVTDAASAIQNVNIGADWDLACSDALHSTEQHMRALNVDVRIYEKLLSFSKRGLLSQQEENVLSMFLNDFEDALVHLPLQQRLAMQSLLQKESLASESYLEADRCANAHHLMLSPKNLASRLFPSSSSRRISSNFADIMSMLQQTESPTTRSEVSGASERLRSKF
jgi:Zn-dependent oligopeptidase